MYTLTSNITVGDYRFKVHEVRVRKSLNNYMDTAIIKIPASARLKTPDQPVTESMDTAKQFQEGDKVKIELGYDGNLKTEFEGFVSRVNFTTPVEIECEGYAWQLRHKSIEGNWKKITLKDLLTEIIKGTDIVLDDSVDEMPIENLTIPQQPLLGVLDYLKEHCFCSVFFKGNVLYAGLKYTKPGAAVKHILRWNVIKDNDLKLRRSGEVNVKINISSEKKDGTKAKGSAGNDGGKVINRLTIVQDEAWLEKMAAKKLQQYDFDGYEGKITTFLIPFTQPGDKSILTDDKYAELSGDYLIESVDVAFTMQGARRINELGIKLT
jgi:hypothetical protein